MPAPLLPLLQFWLDDQQKQEIQKDSEGWIAALEQRVSEKKADAEDFFHLACGHIQNEKPKQAEICFRLALRKNIVHLPSLYGLALQLFILKPRATEPKSLLTRAFRLDPQAEETALRFQRSLKNFLGASIPYEELSRIQTWSLEELIRMNRPTPASHFHLGKLLFEQSRLEAAVPHLKKALQTQELRSEATEYLSYIYEHLYQGDDLVNKTLELASEVDQRADLFFNLAMVCQHEEKRPELAMHFFYLASLEDTSDPGPRFSLEQSALEIIGKVQKKVGARRPANGLETDFLLLLAHLYQGSIGVARKYADSMREAGESRALEFLMSRSPELLWKGWLLKCEGPVERYFRESFFNPEHDRAQILYFPHSQSAS